MNIAYYTADVFTDQVFGGNPLAVIPDARGLDTETMRRITREFNYSESTFVFPPEDPRHTRRVRIFTPAAEMPFAGHPTVGTAFVLAAIGEIAPDGPETRVIFEENVGPVPVTVRFENGLPVYSELTAARLPEFGPTPPPLDEVAALLGLHAGDLIGGDWSPQGSSCGVPFLFVPLRDRSVLARARLDLPRWERTLGGWWARELFLFCHDPERPGSDLRARMFAPGLGVGEDPATGAAASALAGYLAARSPLRDGTLRWTVEQGFEMGRPSILRVSADLSAGQIRAVRVGGQSVLVSRGTLTLPEAR